MMGVPSARALMFQGTGSDVGKSTIVAGLCRLFAQRGLRVRPFKPQNMSNNAAVTDDGGEIGRAQALQARACGVPASVHMNPVLLKPESDRRCQVIVQGRVFGTWEAGGYQKQKPSLLPYVCESFTELKHDADLVLVEGAGSPAETNLRAGDIANMGFALAANVPVCLVADIDRGGVIASLVGTHRVLDDEDNARIVGYLINKFRGDPALFEGGLANIAKHTQWPCFGVLPWQPAAARLPSEDGVALERLQPATVSRSLKVAVPMLSRIANFDDLDPLAHEPNVQVMMIPPGRPLPRDADLVILPGTKATIADLRFLRAQGWDVDLQAHVRQGGHVLGLCGGYQMLGTQVDDPEGVEGSPGSEAGLSLLQVQTRLHKDKCLVKVTGTHVDSGEAVTAYEIHAGRTAGPDAARPVFALDNRCDGARSASGRIQGTYLHGVFEQDGFRHAFLRSLRPELTLSSQSFSHAVDEALDELALALSRHLNVDALLAAAR